MAIQLNLVNFLDRIDHSWLEVLSKANSVTFDPINDPVWSVDVAKQGMTLSLFHYDSAWTKLKGSVIFMQNLTVNFSGFLLHGICMKGTSFPNTVLSGRMTTTCCIQNEFSLWNIFIPPASTKLKGGYTGITSSVCPSVCPSVDRIVSALYLQEYSSDPFHICTSYQTTSEGVSRVMPVSKFRNLKFWQIF